MGRLRHEAGQTVVLIALLFPLVLGLGAIAVDVGYWYVVTKTAQDAADAAALAAVREDGCDDAARVGRAYGWQNMPEAKNIAVTPWCEIDEVAGVESSPAISSPGANTVLVTVEADADTFFGRVFGVLDAKITRRAVARRTSSDGNLAIFAHDDDCEAYPLEFSGAGVYINGLVHANGRFRISEGPFWAALGTHNRPNCPPSIEPTVQTQFGESKPPPWGTACAGLPCREPTEDVFQDWRVWFRPTQLGWFSGCTFRAATIEVSNTEVRLTGPDQVIRHDGTIPSGSYCATDSFHLAGDGIRGKLTALSPAITVDGSDHTLEPFVSDVLFFTVPNNDFNPDNDGTMNSAPNCNPSPAQDMLLDGSGHSWRGILFSPCGRIVVNLGAGRGGAPALVGSIHGLQVQVNGAFEMIGKGDFQYTTALVE